VSSRGPDAGLSIRVPLPLAEPREVVRHARAAEQLGFDGVTVGDHWSQPRWFGSGRAARIDPLVALGAVAAATEAVELQTSVLCAAHHHPAVVARAFATLQQMSGGRAVLGVGAGWDLDELEGYGFPAQRRVSRMVDFLGAVRAAWSGSPYDGSEYQMPSPPPGALGVGTPVPAIVAGAGPRTVAAAARHADRMSLQPPWLGAGRMDFPAAVAYGDRELAARYAEVRGVGLDVEAYVIVSISHDAARRRGELARAMGVSESALARSAMFAIGTDADVVARLRELVALGIHRFELRLLDGSLADLASVCNELRRDALT
jgi:alkanesulfonate monooxygenase SsuD/methylene tetrahydromethanopterin reductase-like flavin-dependent oxidoreductase (luciferase family)